MVLWEDEREKTELELRFIRVIEQSFLNENGFSSCEYLIKL